MTLSSTAATASVSAGVVCDVAAACALEADAAQLLALRQGIEPACGEPLPASSLKHLDEQTLVALAAVYGAIRAQDLRVDFQRWAVVAAPRFLGRAALIVSLQRYAVEGAWGMSPHFIPHRTLHSVSGTVSMALGIHGPNFGIDGGPAGSSQAVLAAATLLSTGTLPGVWLLLSGWEREPLVPLAALVGKHEAFPKCRAVALALVPRGCAANGLQARVLPGTLYRAGSNGTTSRTPLFGLDELAAAVAAPPAPGAHVAWRLCCGGKMELANAADGATP